MDRFPKEIFFGPKKFVDLPDYGMKGNRIGRWVVPGSLVIGLEGFFKPSSSLLRKPSFSLDRPFAMI